ncbi:MAG: methionine synthase [Sphaerochaetaceae bacterium]
MNDIREMVQKRILVLDGAMGTMIQARHLDAAAFRDFRTKTNETSCNEVLNLNRPDVIESIHRAYLDVGADIIETNTFCATRFSLAEYSLQDDVRLINMAACDIAQRARGNKKAWIAGDIGPGKEALSLSTKVEDPTFRLHTFSDFTSMYREQAEALLDGGVDLFLIETEYDTLVAKSAIHGCLEAMRTRGRTVPVMVSMTFSDNSGRTLAGQTLESVVVSLGDYPLFSLGINCSTGAKEMIPKVKRLASLSPFFVSAHPNAGFPDEEGRYQVDAETFAEELRPIIEEGDVNIIGGCCGTTPDHISAVRKLAEGIAPHRRIQADHKLSLASLDVRSPKEKELFVIGERTNVAGSSKFAALAQQGLWDEALAVARDEVEHGADVLDICMDAPLLDAKAAMVAFLRTIQSDPSVNRLPVMIDSSDFSVVQAAMEEIQGKCIINSISLKEGEDVFREHAGIIHDYGHAMVVMLFDEQGQADTYERKIACAKRSYDMLLSIGIPPEDIIIDPNVLAIATGIPEHDRYARSFIEAVAWIHANLPFVHCSGGVSNLSFAFRGNNAVRSAMHAVFLSLAHLDMAIINPNANRDIFAIGEKEREIISNAFLAGDRQSNEDLVSLAGKMVASGKRKKETIPQTESWKTLPARERIAEAVVHGDDSFLGADLASLDGENPLSLVEGPLMSGMGKVGNLFGEGKLFLPQVVRSARTMRIAVDILQPKIQRMLKGETKKNGSHKSIVMATVKGDVHDIGKNIVSLVLSCNNFEVHDLGVMVDAKRIWEEVEACHADLVGLSGLITPSLGEMARTISYFQEHGSRIPIFVGGATTSPLHTALKLAPLYDGPVIQTSDASTMAIGAMKAVGKNRERYFAEVRNEYQSLKQPRETLSRRTFSDAFSLQSQNPHGSTSGTYGVFQIDRFPVEELVGRINWKEFLLSWNVPPDSDEARRVVRDGKVLLSEPRFMESLRKGCKAVYGIFKAESDRMDVHMAGRDFYFLRNEATGLCLADLIAKEDDTAGVFVVSSELAKWDGQDPYRSLLAQMLYDRMAEVLADETQKRMMALWDVDTKTIRPAPGYPTYPDHSEKKTLFDVLDATRRIGVRLTETYAMDPPSSICALVIAAPMAAYFSVGKISREQLRLYAGRKGVPADALVPFIQEVAEDESH